MVSKGTRESLAVRELQNIGSAFTLRNVSMQMTLESM